VPDVWLDKLFAKRCEMKLQELDGLTEAQFENMKRRYCNYCHTPLSCNTYHVGGVGDVQRWECPECDLKERE